MEEKMDGLKLEKKTEQEETLESGAARYWEVESRRGGTGAKSAK